MSGEDKELAELYAIAQALGPAYVAMVDQQAQLERGAATLVAEVAEHRQHTAELTAELSARLSALEAANGWDDGAETGLFADVAGTVRTTWAATDARLTEALHHERLWIDRAQSDPAWQEARDEAVAAGARLLAAIDKALELTDPLRNPTLGGTFLGAVGVQVREAILAELAGAPVLGHGETK